jgi:hypothetical protein
MQEINYIPHREINKEKWNACIDASANGLIYAYAWYLDALQVQWDALVLNDYETVMPLTWKKKYGIYYLYQPWFCASLGIFSKKEITAPLVETFLNSMPGRFRYFDIYLNYKNFFELSTYSLTERTNYVLQLRKPYEEIAAAYRTNLKRNIKKAAESGLEVKKNIPLHDILLLAKETMQRISDISEEELYLFEQVFTASKQHQQAETMGIYHNNHELLASAVFLFSHKRWYYILVGNHPNGKTLGASHYLIDRFIYAHAGENALLDFEGSDIRNLAFFYSSYGAVEEKYPALRINKLPRILRWMKS